MKFKLKLLIILLFVLNIFNIISSLSYILSYVLLKISGAYSIKLQK